MDRPNLQGRVPDTITARLPGGESDGAGTETGGPTDDDRDSDSDGSDSRRWTTLLTLAGLGLAARGVVLRYVLDRRGDDEGDAEDERDRPDFDRDRDGSVEIVGDAGAIDVADDAPTDESETTAEGGDDAAETESDESAAVAETELETEVAVETFEADRPADDTGVVIDESDADAEREGPPRIAPLVGMVALVGIRLFTERVRKRVGDAPAGTADAAGQL